MLTANIHYWGRPGALYRIVGGTPRERELVSISTAEPYGIESTEGLSEFVVLQTQVSAHPIDTV